MFSVKSLTFAAAAAAAVASAAPLERRSNSGQATFFDAGLGACGWTNSGSDMIVAVTPAMYAGGANCGKSLWIKNSQTGITQHATVADLCPTCGGTGDLDMSRGLFSALGGTENQGVFQMTWDFGSSGSSSSSSNNKNQNAQSQSHSSSSSSSSTHSATPSSTSSSSSHSATPTSTSSHSSSSSSSHHTETATASATATTSSKAEATSASYKQAKNTVTGTPAWWAEVQDYCGLDTQPKYPVAISPSKLYETEDLIKACGKAVSLKNPANNKTVMATVVSYLPGGEENAIAMGDAYRVLSDNYDAPSVLEVQWGIVNSTKSSN